MEQKSIIKIPQRSAQASLFLLCWWALSQNEHKKNEIFSTSGESQFHIKPYIKLFFNWILPFYHPIVHLFKHSSCIYICLHFNQRSLLAGCFIYKFSIFLFSDTYRMICDYHLLTFDIQLKISAAFYKYEPRHEKTCFCPMQTTKAQISLHIQCDQHFCCSLLR